MSLLSQGFLKPSVPFSVGQTPVTRYLYVTAEAGDGPVAGPCFSIGAPLCERWSDFSPVWLNLWPLRCQQLPTSFLQGLKRQHSSPRGIWKP